MAETASGSAVVTKNGLRLFDGPFSVDYDSLYELDANIPASTTDQLVPLSLDFSECVGVFIYGDQDFTVETDDGTTPVQTLSFTAEKPLIWIDGDPRACPFTSDFDGLYVTTGAIGSAGLNLQIVVLQNLP